MSGFRAFRVLSYGPLRVWGLLRCRVTEVGIVRVSSYMGKATEEKP